MLLTLGIPRKKPVSWVWSVSTVPADGYTPVDLDYMEIFVDTYPAIFDFKYYPNNRAFYVLRMYTCYHPSHPYYTLHSYNRIIKRVEWDRMIALKYF